MKLSKRMAQVKKEYLKTPVACGREIAHAYGNHPMTLHWLRGYLDSGTKALTTNLRRSYAEVAELENSCPVLTDNELICGQADFNGCFENEEFTKLAEMYKMAHCVSEDQRNDHMALDYERLLRTGVRGLINEIKEQKSRLDFSGSDIAENIEKEEFYDCALMELEALIAYAHRYSDALRVRADETSDAKRKAELLAMSENLARVPEFPARTFWEALQSIHFYTFTLRGLYSAGRPDQLLIKYYRDDIACGRITKEFTEELIDNFNMIYVTYIYPYTALGMMVGGTASDGTPIENELTWEFLRSVDRIKMSDPNIALCVTPSMSDALLTYAFDMIGRGCTFPSFWNDEKIVSSLIRHGFDEKDAHNYINSTCVELTIIGKSAMWTTAPYHVLPSLLLDVFNTGEYTDFDSLKNDYFELVTKEFIRKNHEINILKLEHGRNATEAMRHSCLVDNCIASGKPVGAGGAIYNHTLPNVLGFANAVDSLCAIRELVFEKKEISLDEYRKAVKANFVGYEVLRQRIINRLPHYGNNDDRADEIAKELTVCMKNACGLTQTIEGDGLIPGIFSYNYYVLYGSRTPATPDGRLAGMPLADSCGAVQGRDMTSPTALIESVTKWNQDDFLGGVAFNIRLSKRYFKENMDIPKSLLKTFFVRGGCQIQFNCIDSDDMRRAMEAPEEYEDLVVRIGGYSDYFVRLPEKQQLEIIERTDY